MKALNLKKTKKHPDHKRHRLFRRPAYPALLLEGAALVCVIACLFYDSWPAALFL
jgi:hypothetical protein